jgi:hypothetical protein
LGKSQREKTPLNLIDGGMSRNNKDEGRAKNLKELSFNRNEQEKIIVNPRMAQSQLEEEYSDAKVLESFPAEDDNQPEQLNSQLQIIGSEMSEARYTPHKLKNQTQIVDPAVNDEKSSNSYDTIQALESDQLHVGEEPKIHIRKQILNSAKIKPSTAYSPIPKNNAAATELAVDLVQERDIYDSNFEEYLPPLKNVEKKKKSGTNVEITPFEGNLDWNGRTSAIFANKHTLSQQMKVIRNARRYTIFDKSSEDINRMEVIQEKRTINLPAGLSSSYANRKIAMESNNRYGSLVTKIGGKSHR